MNRRTFSLMGLGTAAAATQTANAFVRGANLDTAGAKYGIKMLSPEEAGQALPHFGGLGANRT